MRVNLPLEFTDQARRSVRAALGRGGQATRKEIRIFAERAIRDALRAAPEPKPKRAKPLPPPPRPIDCVPGEAICSNCERPKDEHGKMGLTCPPRPGRVKGQRFSQVAS